MHTSILEDRTALITGGSRGIGLAIARRVLDLGGKVCLTSRKQAGLDEALDALEAGPRAIAVAGSSVDAEHRRRAVAKTIEAFGTLDLLVNNAATNPQYGPLVEAETAAVRKILEVNVMGPLGWIQEAWQQRMSDSGGAILNVASVNGLRTVEKVGAYNVSKAAVLQLTRQMALELAPKVRVNAVAPGLVKTKFARVLWEGREEEAAAAYPLARLGEPEDVAGIACFLLSDDASWITGATVVVDGGVLLVQPE
ncbi:MAG: SDR family oxidoreductase [Bryobacterales bacterium]|nr:SDR family oxidoreductase [Bryobacterales bacterium]MDE0293317.1 SDR family oxidoreductase [Bryobacterales bacterium]